ncbi:hypothetical protein ACWDUM_25900 [Rhodococcus sp. NPDC003322]
MGASRIILLLTVVCCTAVVGGCAHSVDGSAAPTTQQVTATTTTSAAPRTTTRTQPTTTSTAPAAQVAEYMGGASGSYYFTSPSSKFECAVVTAPNPVAGCHGKLPATAPQVPAPGGPGTMAPNAIRVTAAGPGEFAATGDPAFHRFDGTAKALPYGSALRVQGFTCTVDEHTGVTCASAAGHGFTVSDAAYRLW